MLKTTMGNLGGAHSMCESEYMPVSSVLFECTMSTVIDTSFAEFGLISN